MKKSIMKALPQLLLVTVVIIIAAVLEGFLSLSMMDTIDAALAGNKDLFKEEVMMLLFIAAALLPLNVIIAYGKGTYKRKAIVSAKVNFVKKVFNKNINEFQRDNNSKYVSAMTNDVNTIETSYIEGIYGIVFGACNFIVGIFVIAYVSPIALVAGIAIGIVSSVIAMILGKPLQKHQTQRSDLYEGYTGYIKEVLSAFHIIKSNNLSNKVRKDFTHKSEAIQDKGYVIDKLYTYISALQNLNMMIALYGLLGVTAFMAIKGNITLGGVILIVSSMEKIMMPIMELSEWLPKIFSTKKLFKKLDDILKNQDEYDETITLDGFDKVIEFKDVSFAYDEEVVLKDINLSIEKGGKYLVIGPSGGGKSTLLKLLRKYFAPKDGKILVDSMNLRDVTKVSYFKHISNVEQQVFLFEDTLKNNITLYKDYSEKEIQLAIDRAGLRDFVDAQVEGLDTVIYDNGKNVSGGEKSRIAIARGLLENADIIFLDEAFASLDSKIAKEIERTILSLEGITVVNVSHVIFEESKGQYDKVFMVKNKEVSCI